jgi:uncharacterized iron-regulated membrane protein
MTSISQSQQDAVASSRLYRAVWRWHFYAGLFVVPFLLTLALSGLAMLWFTGVAPEYGDWLRVSPQGQPLAVSAQADHALAAYPGGKLGKYIAPWGPNYVSVVQVNIDSGNRMVAVNPYTGAIVQDRPQDGTWNDFFMRIHGELLIGTDGGPGDFLIETAASLGIILLATGLYLWWPRNGRSLTSALAPQPGLTGRPFWKSLHESLGIWIAAVLLFFLLSGLAWTGIWGGKFVQAWSTFPAEKWEAVTLSDERHASMNHGSAKDVPWTLEQTLMPESGSKAGVTGLPMGTPVVLDSVYALGRAIGFAGRFQIQPPADEKGVWTLSQDSMSYDSTSPTADRTVHIDQYMGNILADVNFADYPLPGKAMAAGIALHEGQLGWWNVALNALFCLSVMTMCLTGVVMWWKRRPAGELGAPRYPRDYRLTAGVAVIALALGLAFPLGGLAILAFAVFDTFLLRRSAEASLQNI